MGDQKGSFAAVVRGLKMIWSLGCMMERSGGVIGAASVHAMSGTGSAPVATRMAAGVWTMVESAAAAGMRRWVEGRKSGTVSSEGGGRNRREEGSRGGRRSRGPLLLIQGGAGVQLVLFVGCTRLLLFH